MGGGDLLEDFVLAGVVLGALDFVEDGEVLGHLLIEALLVARAGEALPTAPLAESKELVDLTAEGDKMLVEVLRALALCEA